MKKNKLNHNKQIMFGIMAMAIVVLCVVIFFWMWCLPPGGLQAGNIAERSIILNENLMGDSLQIIVGDDTVYNARSTGNESVKFTVPNGTSAFIVIDVRNTCANTFEIPETDKDIILERVGNDIKMRPIQTESFE